MLVIESELKGLQNLATKDLGDFEAEAKRLIGPSVYQLLVKAGLGVQDIVDEIRRMVRERSLPKQEQMELRLGQDAAAQCQS